MNTMCNYIFNGEANKEIVEISFESFHVGDRYVCLDLHDESVYSCTFSSVLYFLLNPFQWRIVVKNCHCFSYPVNGIFWFSSPLTLLCKTQKGLTVRSCRKNEANRLCQVYLITDNFSKSPVKALSHRRWDRLFHSVCLQKTTKGYDVTLKNGLEQNFRIIASLFMSSDRIIAGISF